MADNDGARISLDDPNELARELLTPRIVWAGLSMSTVLYVAISWLATQGGPAPGLDPTVIYILCGIGLAAAAASVVVRRFLPQPSSESVGSVSLSPDQVKVATNRFMVGLMVPMALGEVPAILGLLLSLATHDLRFSLAATGLSLVTFGSLFPQAERLRGFWRAAAG